MQIKNVNVYIINIRFEGRKYYLIPIEYRYVSILFNLEHMTYSNSENTSKRFYILMTTLFHMIELIYGIYMFMVYHNIHS